MNRWQQWNEKFDALSQREKVLALLAGLIVIVMIGVTYSVEPLLKQNRELRREMITLEASSKSLEMQKLAYEQALSVDPNAEYQVQLERLRQRFEEIEQTFATEISQLVPPSAMPELMATMMGLSGNLTLNEMSAMAPVNLFADKDEMKDIALYQHGVRMEFSGTYANAQAFLEQLEGTQWQVYWRVMRFDVESYPSATLSIEFYTLSTEEVFIRV